MVQMVIFFVIFLSFDVIVLNASPIYENKTLKNEDEIVAITHLKTLKNLESFFEFPLNISNQSNIEISIDLANKSSIHSPSDTRKGFDTISYLSGLIFSIKSLDFKSTTQSTPATYSSKESEDVLIIEEPKRENENRFQPVFLENENSSGESEMTISLDNENSKHTKLEVVTISEPANVLPENFNDEISFDQLHQGLIHDTILNQTTYEDEISNPESILIEFNSEKSAETQNSVENSNFTQETNKSMESDYDAPNNNSYSRLDISKFAKIETPNNQLMESEDLDEPNTQFMSQEETENADSSDEEMNLISPLVKTQENDEPILNEVATSTEISTTIIEDISSTQLPSTTISTTTVFQCSSLSCSIEHCNFGRKKDQNDCEICECMKNPDSNDQCKIPVCSHPCFYGSFLDENGCESCLCKPRPKPKNVYKCPKLECDSCNYGSIKDEYGCETCICIRPNSVEPSFTCPQDPSCPYGPCKHGSILNDYGCPTCDCLKSQELDRQICAKHRCPPCQNGIF